MVSSGKAQKMPTAAGARSSRGVPPIASAPASANNSQRGLFDTIVQGALVDLFQSCGVALAPQPRGRLDVSVLKLPEITAAINFTLTQPPNEIASPGRITLSLPSALFEIMHAEPTRRPQQLDWIRELTNQLAAHIKHRLLPFCASMQPSLPGLLSRDAFEAQRARLPSLRLYLGRTLRGDVLVTVDGQIDESRLIYSGPADVGSAGDIILF